MVEPELIDADGTRLFVRRCGDGDPVLLINGIGAHHGMWEPLDTCLGNFSTIAYDAPGVGRSPGVRLPFSMAGLGRLAARLVETLEIERVDVIGYSFGGAVAQEMARQAPERVRRLVLVATGCGWGGVPGTPGPLAVLMSPLRYRSATFDRLTAGVLAGTDVERDPGFVERLGDLKRRHPPTWFGYSAQLAALTGWSSLRWLHKLPHPTLVVQGDRDQLVPLANGAILASRIPAARLLTQHGEGHFLLLDPESSSLSSVAEFLGAADHRTSSAWMAARSFDDAEADALARATRNSAQPFAFFNAMARAATRRDGPPAAHANGENGFGGAHDRASETEEAR